VRATWITLQAGIGWAFRSTGSAAGTNTGASLDS
jgi:hypothetical protein